jgi:hypothetical protein
MTAEWPDMRNIIIDMHMQQLGFADKKYHYAHVMLNYFVEDLKAIICLSDYDNKDIMHDVHVASGYMYRVMSFIKNNSKHDKYTTDEIKMIGQDLAYIHNKVWLVYYSSILDFAERLAESRNILMTFYHAIDHKIPFRFIENAAEEASQ